MELSERLQSVRSQLGLSQSQAAKAWGINFRTLQAWEQGKRNPSRLALERLEQILDQAIKEHQQQGKPKQ